MRSLRTLALLLLLGRPLSGQEAAGVWKFGNLQQGYCITFLVSPEDAQSLLPDDAQPIRLDAIPDAPPFLLRVAKDEPQYGAWMPAAVCVYRFGRVDVTGREILAPNGGSEMIGIVSFRARTAVNQPDNGVAVSLVFTNDRRMAKLTDSTQVPFRQIDATFGNAAHGDDERHVLRFGKATLIWDGHMTSDSAALGAPLERVWVASGRRGKPVLLRWTLKAASSRSMVGALVVEGKDRLARIMRASPIRYLGPVYQGGTAELAEVGQ